MQDRILGPLTMLQFIEAVVGGGLAYASYISLPAPLGAGLGVIIALLTGALVFVKINERPFGHFLLSFVVFLFKPKTRIWHKGEASDLSVEIVKPAQKDNKKKVSGKKISRDDIRSIASQVDSDEYLRIKQ